MDETLGISTAIGTTMVRGFNMVMDVLRKVQTRIEWLADKLGGTDKLLRLVAITAAAIFAAFNFSKITSGLQSILKLMGGINLKTVAIVAVIILLALLLVFAGLFCVYLHWLTGYFETIYEKMDILLQDTPVEISLPPEMLPIERKMNLIKSMMDRQKSDMLLAEQKKNDLVMYLAHDLKTPLASSISYLNLLRDEKQISEELREKYLTIALAKSEWLEDLINEFLEIARYSLSTITLQYSEINLTRLLEQLVYEFQPVLDQKGLTCRLATGDDLLLNCDAGKMQRVFDNLLRNAVNYSCDGTEITIEAESGGDCVKLRFSNHGGTIPQEKLERIFEQFYRLDTGRGSSGAGLGLAIAKQIVTLHKGTITAESGDGLTVFTVTLPV